MSEKINDTEDVSAEITSTCPNCIEVDSVSIITRKIGGVVRYYYQCSACGYRWPVPQS